MGSLDNPSPASYQSIPDAAKTSKPPPERPSAKSDRGRRRRSVARRSFAWGALLGAGIGWLASTIDVRRIATARRGRLRPVGGVLRGGGAGPRHSGGGGGRAATVSVGPRPYFLINELDDDDGPNATFRRPGLKATLRRCAETLTTFRPSDFVLGHRGAALQFPEHTDRGHDAASRMGAGAAECDVDLTKDQKLASRHERCDLHETTDVLARPRLAAKCSRPFRPAGPTRRASAKCCTTDFALREIQDEMCGRMSSRNGRAKTVDEYLSRPPEFQTGLYSHDCPRVQSHADFVRVVDANGGNFVPEFKELDGTELSKLGLTREEFVQMVLDDYENITDAERVRPQSFAWEDLYYLTNRTRFGKHTYALDKNLFATTYSRRQLRKYFAPLIDGGVSAIAPAIPMLLELDERGDVVPTGYARAAREAGLGIVAWTLERSRAMSESRSSWYYSRLAGALRTDADLLKVTDVLYEDVGVEAIFTDWPSVVSFYANCKGIRLR